MENGLSVGLNLINEDKMEVYEQFKTAYLSKKESEKLFLTGLRHGVEIIVSNVLNDYLEEAVEQKDAQYRKQPLESQIAFMYKKERIRSDISSLMHIVRICGNYGTHFQEGAFNTIFSDMAGTSATQILDWYYGEYLETDIRASDMLREVSKTVFIVHDNESDRQSDLKNPVNHKAYAKRRLISAGFDAVDFIKMIAGSVAVSVILYYFINR